MASDKEEVKSLCTIVKKKGSKFSAANDNRLGANIT
jgi:hypothetical protein